MFYRSIFVTLTVLLVSASLSAQSDFSIGVGQVALPDAVETVGGALPASVVVNFPITFDEVPAVFILPDTTNPDPATYRVHTVTTSSFEVFVSESEGEDGINWPSSLPFEYLAIEPNDDDPTPANRVYQIGSNLYIQVGIESSVSNYRSKLYGGDSWLDVNFTSEFTALNTMGYRPVVISEIQTLDSDPSLLSGPASSFNRTTEPWLETAMDNVTSVDFDLALERAETITPNETGFSGSEDIAWLAILDVGDNLAEETFQDDALADVELKAFFSGDLITGNCVETTLTGAGLSDFTLSTDPVYFGSQVTWDGGDGGWARRCSSDETGVFVEIEEDLATDTDQAHTTEEVGFVAFSGEFETTDDDTDGLNFNMVVGVEDGIDSIPVPTISYSYSLAPQSVNFSTEFGGNFSSTPVVIPMSTSEGNGDPAMVRVWGVSDSGFNISATIPEGTLAPDGTPRAPDGMTVDFIAVVPGTHILPDGAEIRAGTGTSNLCIGSVSSCAISPASYTAVPIGFTAAPTDAVVLAAAQTINNDFGFDPEDEANPFLSTSIVNKTGSSFDFSFELAQTDLGSANPLASSETYGWVAVESGLEGNLRAAEGTTTLGNHLIEYKTLYPAGTIGGWDDSASCYSFSYTTAFTAAINPPLVIATHNTRNGADGGWLRRCSSTAGAVSLVFDEDTNSDTERSHGGQERASIFAFSDTFAWGPTIYRNRKTSAIEWDPISLFAVGKKAIPGSWTRYTVVVENLDRIGANDNSVEIVDNVPSDTTLFVGDLDGAGCPIEWSENGDPSGLTFTCASDLRLHNGGSCAPQDSDGYCAFSTFSFESDWEASINSIKVAPSGEFRGSDGSTTPEFEIQFRVRLD